MASDIEWLRGADGTKGFAWNPTLGCSRVSAGCDNCYAMRLAHRKLSPSHVGLTRLRPRESGRGGVDWNGSVRLMPGRVVDPLGWKKPRRIFVNSMSDLFHPSIPFAYIDQVFEVMKRAYWHTFLVLTKRPHRASLFYGTRATREGAKILPNVHLGVSAEDQESFDLRVPLLHRCAAAVRWVSAEPLIGPIVPDRLLHGLDWVVIGGESGPGSRVCQFAWIRALVKAGRAAGLKVFVKQSGTVLHGAGAKGTNMLAWPEDIRVRDLP